MNNIKDDHIDFTRDFFSAITTQLNDKLTGNLKQLQARAKEILLSNRSATINEKINNCTTHYHKYTAKGSRYLFNDLKGI